MRLLDGPREIKKIRVLQDQRAVDALLQQPSLEFLDAVVDFSFRRGEAWVGHGATSFLKGCRLSMNGQVDS